MVKRDSGEKRDSVRATLCADIEYSVLEAQDHEALKKRRQQHFRRCGPSATGRLSCSNDDDPLSNKGADPQLIDFLLHLEGKIDRLMELLTRQQQSDQGIFLGRGLDIGGGGMRMLCEKGVRPGQVLDVRFRISRYPVVSLQAFAKVVRVICSPEDQGLYEVALEFMDMDEADRELIISYVFQIQREAIRNRKRGDHG